MLSDFRKARLDINNSAGTLDSDFHGELVYVAFESSRDA